MSHRTSFTIEKETELRIIAIKQNAEHLDDNYTDWEQIVLFFQH